MAPGRAWYEDADTDSYVNVSVNQTFCERPAGDWFVVADACGASGAYASGFDCDDGEVVSLVVVGTCPSWLVMASAMSFVFTV